MKWIGPTPSASSSARTPSLASGSPGHSRMGEGRRTRSTTSLQPSRVSTTRRNIKRPQSFGPCSPEELQPLSLSATRTVDHLRGSCNRQIPHKAALVHERMQTCVRAPCDDCYGRASVDGAALLDPEDEGRLPNGWGSEYLVRYVIAGEVF